MKRKILVLGMTGILALGIGFELWAQEQLVRRGKVELLFEDIPVVITASRREQPITEAPVTVTVITAEDIKQSGATNIPDILRMVAGVDVMAITVRDQPVSIRGFNMSASNKLLVMIDGRSVYFDGYGTIFWDLFPISLEEIRQIEIVKSPGSSLYGANAFCGVINIITKTPAQIKGTELNLTGGNYNTFLGSILHAGVTEKIDYKVSAGWDRTNEWRDNDESAGEITKVNVLVEYKIGEENKLSLSGGRVYSKDRKWFPSERVGVGKVTGNLNYLQFGFDYSDVKFRSYYRGEDIDVKWLRTGEKQPWFLTTLDTELQHSLNLGKKHSLIWGGNYRYNTIEKNSWISQDYSHDLWSLFLENEGKIMDNLTLTLGGRYDHHPLVKEHFSPRGNISYSPVKEHIIRLSAGAAFRNPTLIESYLYIERELTTTFPVPFPPFSFTSTFTFISQGNKELKSEGITSYELGYRATWLKKIISNLNLFYNEYTDFVRYVQDITYYEANDLFPGSPGGLIPKRVVNTVQNTGDAWGTGGEIDLDILITDWLSGTASYSYLQITDKEDDIFTTQINEKDRVRLAYPKNKVNAGLRAKFENGISANLLAHWVDETKRLITDLKGKEYLYALDAYTIFNIRMGYTFLNEKAEVSLAVFNLFNDKHYQYPQGVNLPDYSSDEIGRRITAQMNYKF